MKKPPLGSIRIRLAFLYSILLFGLASLVVGGIYLSLSNALDDEPMSRTAAFQVLGEEMEELNVRNSVVDSSPELEEAQPYLVAFEQAVNRRALTQLRSYSVASLVALFLASMVIGWYVSGMVLRPIGRITAVARHIQATDLSQRIELGGPTDELRDLADTFDNMLDRLDEAFEGQRRFIQEASHELRNPLAVMRTNLDVVMDDPEATTEDFRIAGEVAGRSAIRMSALVDDLLLYAHHKRPDAQREPLDLSILVAETVEDFAAAAARVPAILNAEVAPDLLVVGDGVALRRALANLLNNALRVVDPQGSVTVTAGHDDQQIWISVADDGPGLSAQDLPRVFQRFWKGDRASSREDGRSGLGLAIVRQIAEGHGGQVTVRSELGEGATFTLWFPRYVEA
ncbi:MAG: HAMP domain-containing histidine kinase [Actinobacteria bacterium]|nr:HAMP domain-containing histidine kinase [Actinomycetota bacterium]MBT3745442.1 HAMP domain-containing histidine kinase [Actinomycetota bacterium]MBT3970450.1 HAMP domain-containing histidine kinase [Actinomycetota bacterium]MBT4010349.1 HAMP domain-containing histidine kinase [Actinomycetota bacterium]MBT4303691.1 HAMP domain-containing histidine kinase [Actinomycetota bacterium]